MSETVIVITMLVTIDHWSIDHWSNAAENPDRVTRRVRATIVSAVALRAVEYLGEVEILQRSLVAPLQLGLSMAAAARAVSRLLRFT